MHIYFSGIGGAGIGPLAEIAHQAGFTVSGSDKRDSSYVHELKNNGINNIFIGQSYEQIQQAHKQQPIDWLVYSSAVTLENSNAPEIIFAAKENIKYSKRDVFINFIISTFNLKLIAVAGTHGKTTTTALTVWLADQIKLNLSYILPAKTSFARLGHFDKNSKYLAIEADEFDNNFLSFRPEYSLISGLAWDHHEFFNTQEAYNQAFQKFIDKSTSTLIWQEDADKLKLKQSDRISIISQKELVENNIKLYGHYNRLDALLVIQLFLRLSSYNSGQLSGLVNNFPGLSRRMEQIIPNLYSDYAHTPEKIKGLMSIATEMAATTKQRIIIIYEPLTNRRQHFIKEQYANCFQNADLIYWVPSYLAREDSNQVILSPSDLIQYLEDPSKAHPQELNKQLKNIIISHLNQHDMVIAISGGGGQSLDEWLRNEFQN